MLATCPFSDGTYTISDPATTVVSTWTSDSDIASINSYLDCGALAIEWRVSQDSAAYTAIDETQVFTVDSSSKTITVQTNDASKAGSYRIYYRTWLQDYVEVLAVIDYGFTYTIVGELCSTATVSIPAQTNPDDWL